MQQATYVAFLWKRKSYLCTHICMCVTQCVSGVELHQFEVSCHSIAKTIICNMYLYTLSNNSTILVVKVG